MVGNACIIVAVAAFLLSPPPPVLAQDEEEGAKLLQSHSRAPYVHRIALYDHDGEVIDPRDGFAGPYSPKKTCGKCHPYAQVAAGWHFNAADESVPAGRPGEPWFLVDPDMGTQLPISGRRWPGAFRPAEAGLTNWQFVMMFGHHMPGGGFGEPDGEQLENATKKLRWRISGPLEIDCMFCHAADQQHDPAEASRQIEKENFQWAPTAALGLAVIRGEARKAPDDWDPMMPPDPDFPEQAGPKLVWDLARFDPDDRVLFNITRRPPAERCYFCHSFREVGPDATDEIVASRDVHLAAGMTCVDCHRNGLDHMIVRGYETEAAERGEPAVAAFSCAGCHLGMDTGRGALSLGGLHGAPHPQHRGLPPVHFEKLTCTACHSGPWPEMYARRFQTSLAHGLGLATREREDDDLPHIVGPVFARQADGKIAPQRLVWDVRRRESNEINRNGAGPGIPHYGWPIAHDVRPAAQALGINGCTDCHSVNAPIYFGVAAAAGDDVAMELPVRMYELHGASPELAVAWGLGFGIRPAFKWFGFICAGLVGLVLLHYLLAGIGAITRRFR